MTTNESSKRSPGTKSATVIKIRSLFWRKVGQKQRLPDLGPFPLSRFWGPDSFLDPQSGVRGVKVTPPGTSEARPFLIHTQTRRLARRAKAMNAIFWTNSPFNRAKKVVQKQLKKVVFLAPKWAFFLNLGHFEAIAHHAQWDGVPDSYFGPILHSTEPKWTTVSVIYELSMKRAYDGSDLTLQRGLFGADSPFNRAKKSVKIRQKKGRFWPPAPPKVTPAP